MQEDVIQGLESIEEFYDIREVECSSDDASYSAATESSDTDESVETESEVAGSDEQEVEEGNVSVDEDNYIETPREVRACRGNEPAFRVGMSFGDRAELRKAVDTYAITNGFEIRVARTSRKCMEYWCQEGCPFRLYASVTGKAVGFVLKTLLLEHNCTTCYPNPRATAAWVADMYKDKVQGTPHFKIRVVLFPF